MSHSTTSASGELVLFLLCIFTGKGSCDDEGKVDGNSGLAFNLCNLHDKQMSTDGV